ncbi:hypothetical protein J3458_001965 [Metarhizium acridum]|uniref:uncharacterized protein n=1 Tax=Metarhizium acridum TaxID=92637 RepID=UPI001C6ADD85|nr:hypothetical protein J3458_001965 [Metarhizium acridum]
MGKSRRNRAGASQRRDPLAKPVKAPSDPELAALREAKIIPIINDLQNPDPKSRSAAAAAVANIIEDTKCRKLMLREQIVHIILTQTLTDAALESRAAGWGILQGLAQEEEADFCVHLFRCDILTAIGHAAKNVSEKLLSTGAGSSKLSQPEKSFVISISASLIALLTALAEAADDILEAISSNVTIVDFLFVLVAHSNTNDDESDSVSSLRGDALACLMILTEENGNLAKKIVAHSRCYQVMSSLKNQVTGDGVLACAILHNVFSALEGLKDAPNVTGADDSVLIPTLTKTIATIQPDQHAANGSQGWSNPLELQRLALETLASIGTTLNSANVDAPVPAKPKAEEPKDDEDMDDADAGGSGAEDEEDDDDEMDQDAMEADMEMVTGVDGDDDKVDIDDMPVLKALLQTALPELIRISSFQPTNNDSLQLHGHALSALNNIDLVCLTRRLLCRPKRRHPKSLGPRRLHPVGTSHYPHSLQRHRRRQSRHASDRPRMGCIPQPRRQHTPQGRRAPQIHLPLPGHQIHGTSGFRRSFPATWRQMRGSARPARHRSCPSATEPRNRHVPYHPPRWTA